MATIRYGSMVGDARGSIAAVTYSRNRGGAYARDRVKPTNAPSARRTAARNRMATLQEYWRETATAAHRTSWEAVADAAQGENRLGDTIRLSAVNHFIQINSLKLAAGDAIQPLAPAPPIHADMPALTYDVAVGTGIQILTITPALAAGDMMYWQGYGPASVTRNKWFGPWDRIGFAHVGDAPPFAIVIPAELVIGQRWFFQFRFVTAAGRLSVYNQVTLDITA